MSSCLKLFLFKNVMIGVGRIKTVLRCQKVIKKFLCLLIMSGNIVFSGEIFAAKPAGDFVYDLGFLMAMYLGVDISVKKCVEKHPKLKAPLEEGINLWRNKNLEGITRLDKIFTDYIYKNSKNEMAFELNLTKLKQDIDNQLILKFQKLDPENFESYCRVFPAYIKSKKGDLFQSQKERLDIVFGKDSNVFTSEPKISKKEDRFSSENSKTLQVPKSSERSESKDYLKKLADAKEYDKYNRSVILFINRFANLVNEASEIQDLCSGIVDEEISIDYANKRAKSVGSQVELKLLELEKSVNDIYEPILTSSLKGSVAILKVYISNLPKDARKIIDNYYGLYKATREQDEDAFLKFDRRIRLDGVKLLENQNAVISLEKNKIDEKTPIFYFYDTILNSNRSYIALIHARISELDNPAESGLDYLEGDVALNFKQAEKYIRISKDSVAKG